MIEGICLSHFPMIAGLSSCREYLNGRNRKRQKRWPWNGWPCLFLIYNPILRSAFVDWYWMSILFETV